MRLSSDRENGTINSMLIDSLYPVLYPGLLFDVSLLYVKYTNFAYGSRTWDHSFTGTDLILRYSLTVSKELLLYV
jgi:hypothetical protein